MACWGMNETDVASRRLCECLLPLRKYFEQIFLGDTLCWVGVEPDRMKRVEALDWDQTIGALGRFNRERRAQQEIKNGANIAPSLL